MSVTISKYLKANDNKLTALLKSDDLEGAFLDSSLIKVFMRHDNWWCEIKLNYTLSCNDLDAIATVFDGYWWCISPHYEARTYYLRINLKDDLK